MYPWYIGGSKVLWKFINGGLNKKRGHKSTIKIKRFSMNCSRNINDKVKVRYIRSKNISMVSNVKWTIFLWKVCFFPIFPIVFSSPRKHSIQIQGKMLLIFEKFHPAPLLDPTSNNLWTFLKFAAQKCCISKSWHYFCTRFVAREKKDE